MHGDLRKFVYRGNMRLNSKCSEGMLIAVALSAFGSLIAQDPTIKADLPKKEVFRFRGGNSDEGRQAFSVLNCIQCHSVMNEEIPNPPESQRIEVALAAEVRFVKSYEDLIIAITNPRHVINEHYRAILLDTQVQGELEPFMPDLTDQMSVKQLMDLTAFLHQAYSRELPAYRASEGQ